MRNIHKYLLVSLLVLFASDINAHAVWIELSGVNPVAVGQLQTVKVFFGEYETQETEKTADWYSDLRQLEVFALQPQGEKSKIALKDVGTHLEGTYTPQSEGIHWLATSHPAKMSGGKTLYEFSSQVALRIGKSDAAFELEHPVRLVHLPGNLRKGGTAEVSLKKPTVVNGDQELTLFGPNGWSRKYKTDSSGKIQADLPWSGRYLVEFSQTDKTPGTWAGQSYEARWLALTTSFLVE